MEVKGKKRTMGTVIRGRCRKSGRKLGSTHGLSPVVKVFDCSWGWKRLPRTAVVVNKAMPLPYYIRKHDPSLNTPTTNLKSVGAGTPDSPIEIDSEDAEDEMTGDHCSEEATISLLTLRNSPFN